MAALLKPQPAYDIVKGIKEPAAGRAGSRARARHHRRDDGQPDEGHRSGRDCVDTAISSLSLGPGHNPTESLVEMLEGTASTRSLDMERLLKVKKYFAGKIRPRYKEFLSNITGVETEIFDSQIPGGMISNMESQLKQQGAGDRMEEVLEEVPKVRKDAGLSAAGDALQPDCRHAGGLQRDDGPLQGADRRVRRLDAGLLRRDDRAARPPRHRTGRQTEPRSSPITSRPADLLKPEWQELRATVALPGCNGSDEDVLTYAMFPKVAPKFFTTRAEGPKNLGKDPAAPTAAAAPAPAKAPAAENGKGSGAAHEPVLREAQWQDA
jgi:methylmalonyl-CoA carboxyltransferase 5S subunit